MLIQDEKEVVEVKYFGWAVIAICCGAQVIWEAIRSCFGVGYWDNDQPWDNDDAWVN